MHENKIFFYFLMSWQKPGILIPDLYRYSIKVQADIDQNAENKFTTFYIWPGLMIQPLATMD